MTASRPILCPVDFSDSSAGALRYAAAVASRFEMRLIVLTVEDPLLTEAVDLGTGIVWSPEDCQRELEGFVSSVLEAELQRLPGIDYEVAVGKPASEILRVARERSCALIVMSTHGLTGARKLFFGSTTERVLRETATPVLVTPAADPGPLRFEDARRQIGRILVPVDLSPYSLHQVQLARTLAEALSLPLVFVHVVEPLKTRLAARLQGPGIQADRHAVAEDKLSDLIATVPRRIASEALVVSGDPGEELVKVARDRQAGLIVIGLHGSPPLGPRMGSVTYRLLCLSPGLVLAIPPNTPAPSHDAVAGETIRAHLAPSRRPSPRI